MQEGAFQDPNEVIQLPWFLDFSWVVLSGLGLEMERRMLHYPGLDFARYIEHKILRYHINGEKVNT